MKYRVLYRNIDPSKELKKSVSTMISNSIEYLPEDKQGDLEFAITEVSRKSDGIGKFNCRLTCDGRTIYKSNDDLVASIIETLTDFQQNSFDTKKTG